MEEAAAGFVGLDPLAVEDELGDGTLADVGDDFVSSAGDGFDVDFFVGDGVLVEEALGGAAVAAPGRGVEEKFHSSIFADLEEFIDLGAAFPGAGYSTDEPEI